MLTTHLFFWGEQVAASAHGCRHPEPSCFLNPSLLFLIVASSGGAKVCKEYPVAVSHHYVLWLDIQMNIVLTMDKLDC